VDKRAMLHLIDAAVEISDPTDDDNPPSLVENPRWVRPIEGLFGILGTVSGYREAEVSISFMVALPIFAAMLIGDAGYGLILLLIIALQYKKTTRAMGKPLAHLVMVIAGATMIWGILTGSFFGFGFYKPIIPVEMTDESRALLMNISFVMGAIHLCVAHFWQAARMFPDLRFLNQVGWGICTVGMLGVVRMVVLDAPMGWNTPWPYLLLGGSGLAILFQEPSKNILKMVGLGIANFPFSFLSVFSDIISYVRLMAVGLAGTVLGASFNDLATGLGAWYLTVPVMVAGHALNLGLALIALFAHGVRLNMLEFSNNLGMQWTGYSYKPFSNNTMIQE
jgi:V/A-type H+-transporting ATPase subunit I